jgi:hypothetical protein
LFDRRTAFEILQLNIHYNRKIVIKKVKEMSRINDSNDDKDVISENSSLLLEASSGDGSTTSDLFHLRQERRRQQQQHNPDEGTAFGFGSLASIDELQEHIGELAREMMTFEPTDPEELLREVEEYHADRFSDRVMDGSVVIIDDTNRVGRDEANGVSLDRLSQSNANSQTNSQTHSHSHVEMTSQSINDILTYPEEQVIESHYTEHPEKLGCLSLAVLIFYNVSGGPFGIETTVRAGKFNRYVLFFTENHSQPSHMDQYFCLLTSFQFLGGNFYALLGFLVMPFVWSLQEALMTAELGTTFPEASGGVAWVEEAFGPGAAWICGALGWIAGATDNAIYPVLFLDYLMQVFGNEAETIHPVFRFCVLSGTSIVLAYINWRGLPMVGKMSGKQYFVSASFYCLHTSSQCIFSVGICLVAMSPFVILAVVGAFKVDPARWLTLPVKDTGKIVDGRFKWRVCVIVSLIFLLDLPTY